MEEFWKPCPDYEQYYEVSTLGRIRTRRVFIPNESLFGDVGGYFKKQSIKTQTVNRDGYMTTKLCKDGKCLRRTVHRMVAKAFLENPDNLSQVNHIDGDKTNNQVDNLEWISPSGNIIHAYATGLMNTEHLKGEKNNKAKLTADDVRKIKKMFSRGAEVKDIADAYGVSRTTIYYIKSGRTWKEVS